MNKHKRLSLKEDDLLLMEFRQQHWAQWVQFCHEQGYEATIRKVNQE